jgi:ABC-type multidrug transport system fused ATPase/permease subunit
VCSKIVKDWVESVLPGLLKSSAKGAASAAKAGLNVATVGASDEILDILAAAVNIAGGMIKVLMGLEKNVENFSEAFKTVKNAYDELKNLKDLFGKPPSEIANAMRGIATTATAAVIPEALQNAANSVTTTAFEGLNRRNPYLEDTDTGAATDAIKVVIREGLTVVFLFAYLLWMNWKLTLVMLAILPVIAMVIMVRPWKPPVKAMTPVRPVAALVQQSSAAKLYTSYPYNRPSLNFYSQRQVSPASTKQLRRLWRKQGATLLIDRPTAVELGVLPQQIIGEAESWLLVGDKI